MVDTTPAIMDLQTLETGIPELETTVLETTTTTAVDDLLPLEDTRERDTETEIVTTTDHPAMIVEAEVEVRDEIVCHTMVDHQVEK